MNDSTSSPFIEALRNRGRFSDADLRSIGASASEGGGSDADAAVALGLLSSEESRRILAEACGLPFVDLREIEVESSALEDIDSNDALTHRYLPFSEAGAARRVAFAEPPNAAELGRLRLLLGKRIQVALGDPEQISEKLTQALGLGASALDRAAANTDGEEDTESRVFEIRDTEGVSEDATVSKFVDQVLLEALRLRATDIHLEPYEDTVRLRYRVDGALRAVAAPRDVRRMFPAISSRLKVMGGMDIAERRTPQDGRLTARRGEEEIDLRISTLPTNFGEAICLRILGRETLFLRMDGLGLSEAQESQLRELSRAPTGLTLITGPTGSGKTTTLYAALAVANDEERKVITIEDPVEYQLQGISQIQTREELGVTFARGLRAALRHDPDVILIGEIRDRETVEIALRAAQTGHLVFSTLHTNDSVSAVTRMIEMGADPYLLASSLEASIAQRLARKVCPGCATQDAGLSDGERKEMAAAHPMAEGMVGPLMGEGCSACHERGYRGRVGLYEFFRMTPRLSEAIGPETRSGTLRALAAEQGWRPMREDAWLKVAQGRIPASEVRRLTAPTAV